MQAVEIHYEGKKKNNITSIVNIMLADTLDHCELMSISSLSHSPRQNGHRFTDIFKYIFLNANVWILIKI